MKLPPNKFKIRQIFKIDSVLEIKIQNNKWNRKSFKDLFEHKEPKMSLIPNTPQLPTKFENISEDQKVKLRAVMSQIISDAADRCQTLIKVQSLLHDPKYSKNGETVATKIQPQLKQWMDNYSNEQLKARNSDSKMFTDLKYLVTDQMQKDGDQNKTNEFIGELNRTTGSLKSNYDTDTLLNSGNELKFKLAEIQNIIEGSKPTKGTG